MTFCHKDFIFHQEFFLATKIIDKEQCENGCSNITWDVGDAKMPFLEDLEGMVFLLHSNIMPSNALLGEQRLRPKVHGIRATFTLFEKTAQMLFFRQNRLFSNDPVFALWVALFGPSSLAPGPLSST